MNDCVRESQIEANFWMVFADIFDSDLFGRYSTVL